MSSKHLPQTSCCVTAHPDDECFGFGGALMLAHEAGFETSVICFTDGQAATNRGVAASNAELGRMRREEFAASCRILDVTRYELLDYQDAQLEFADFFKDRRHATRQKDARMRQWKPNVVLTFGMDGALNTHPDHTMVSASHHRVPSTGQRQPKALPCARPHPRRRPPLLQHRQLLPARPPRAAAFALDRHPGRTPPAGPQVPGLPRARLAAASDAELPAELRVPRRHRGLHPRRHAPSPTRAAINVETFFAGLYQTGNATRPAAASALFIPFKMQS